MPTLSISDALLLLSATEGLPWTVVTWQTLTGVRGIPWFTTADAIAPNWHAWTNQKAQSVKAYAESLRNLGSLEAQMKILKNRDGDNQQAGRIAWREFIDTNWTQAWKMPKIIDQVFKDSGCTPYDAMAELDMRQLPHADDFMLNSKVLRPLATRLFGKDAFLNMSQTIKPHIRRFVEVVIANTWNRYRRNSGMELKKLEAGKAEIATMWLELSNASTSPTVLQLKKYISLVQRMMRIMTLYKDTVSLQEFEDKKRELEAMLASARQDKTQQAFIEELPKVIRDALEKLAKEFQVRDVERALMGALETISPDSEELVEIPDAEHIDMSNWREGVEDLRHLSEDELWQQLGFEDKQLPFFQEWTDPEAAIEPWTDEGQKWLATQVDRRQPLVPRWHQLVGILRMLQRAFDGQPIMMMDGVGIGKTLQAVGFIACLAYYRSFFSAHARFPGHFSNKTWQGQPANIPDLPVIIVCPVNIQDQWVGEIHRFLRKGTFDILPYVGKLVTRGAWWKVGYPQSHQPALRRIILAAHTAIQDDGIAVFEEGDSPGSVKNNAAHTLYVDQTVFGYNYSVCVVDEAHQARKHNKLHMALRALGSRSSMMVALTATPVTTKPQDLWIIGQLLGLSAFFDNDQWLKMKRELEGAMRRDRIKQREAGQQGNVLRSALVGRNSGSDVSQLEYSGVMTQWMGTIRDHFAIHVIRRTVDSVNNQGHKIFGLKPFTEHYLLVEMYPWETANLHRIAKNLISDNPLATLLGAAKNFYTEFRQSMLYPLATEEGRTQWIKPASKQAWLEGRHTVKMEMLADIVAHHLKEDGAHLLKMHDDGQHVTPNDDALPDADQYPDCDRIVIYSAFPSANPVIMDVLDLYGIKCVESHGKIPVKNRRFALDAFRKSTRDNGPRVLILSNVGMVGLNLACANIMIMVDSTWSALDDEQLRGRIYRFPQQKPVHIYRLIAAHTPDVFLNNLAFAKGHIHDVFVNHQVNEDFRNMFSRDEPDMLSVDDESDEDTGRKGKGRKETNSKRKALKSPPQSPSKAGSSRKTKKIRKDPFNSTIEDRPSNTKGKGKEKEKANDDKMDVDTPAASTDTGEGKGKYKPKPKVIPPAPAVLATSMPAAPAPSTPAPPEFAVPSASTTAPSALVSTPIPPALEEEDPILAEAALDPNYWKDRDEIEAAITLTFDKAEISPLSSLKSLSPEHTPQLVPPPARRAVRNSSTNNNLDNFLEFGPGHPTTFSGKTRSAPSVRRARRG
ncbi:P-loop containing nucleoside triphosphate hydrolase protein [Lanmaoa asiatica]|nr:P-loop containing nucleoside triphosphate hydrolase protein [Lanmaoa asiatica]